MPDANPVAARGEEVADEAAFFDDWMDRYAWLIEQARALPPMPDALKTDATRVRGCQSQVWMHAARTDDGRLALAADADAEIPKGIAALLVRVLDGQPAEAAAAYDFSFFDAIGLREHLSPTRANGLDAMVRRVKALAGGTAP